MKCPKCNSDMEKGLLNEGVTWDKAESIFSSFIGVSAALGNTIVYAWKCPSCGKVELAAEQ